MNLLFRILNCETEQASEHKQKWKFQHKCYTFVGINFKKAENTKMYRCKCIGCVGGTEKRKKQNAEEEEKNTIPTLWGVVYQTHLQCNEHSENRERR